MSAVSLDPHAYHIDLRDKATKSGTTPATAAAVLSGLTAEPGRANPVSILQVGLGALQLRDRDLVPLVADVVNWVEGAMDERGLLAYRFPMPHTFPLDAPWYSALAQGEAVSLLLRAATVLERPELVELAGRAAESLLDSSSALVVATPEGPVLQEYPTSPPAHVLNGWLIALWGLYDLAGAPEAGADTARRAADAFSAGAAAVAERIDRYRTPVGWSLYDLYPHPLPNVASPFYHRLHVVQLLRQNELAADPRLLAAAGEWRQAATALTPRSIAVARKLAFRTIRPRGHRIRPT
jgi:hypothetical protein